VCLTSIMAMTESLFWRSTVITFWHVLRKLPSIPLTSMAFTSMRVSRNGTRSGNFSRFMLASKQSPKSMWMILPLRAAKGGGSAKTEAEPDRQREAQGLGGAETVQRKTESGDVFAVGEQRMIRQETRGWQLRTARL
jgi:hypothetical protein